MLTNHAVEEARIRAEFERLCETLRDARYLESLGRPIAYWTLGTDRRLPIALLDRSLQSVLQTPFDELARTPGIGQKKLASLIVLLRRAADEPTTTMEQPRASGAMPVSAIVRPLGPDGRFDANLVSEAMWSQWRDTVVEHGLGDERLGRLAPSLQSLPTVIWHTPLKAYVGQSLADIRAMRTHGEKRIKVVLEVFFVVHEMLSRAGLHPRLTLRPAPSFTTEIERWFAEMLARDLLPTEDELRNGLAKPLVAQVENDVSGQVAELVRGRLGLGAETASVREQSKRLGVTRARVYQLLEECAKTMDVRWPEGRRWFEEMTAKFEQEIAAGESREFFFAVRDLFFPAKFAQIATSLLAEG